ncbi:MAG: MnhB domain-containing protein [bacterium]
MNEVLLKIGSRKLLPVFIVISVIILLRGHNHPGGGFIGALVFSAGYILVAIGNGVSYACRYLIIKPWNLIPVGLLTAIVSGIPALTSGKPFLSGLWYTINFFDLIKIKLGTPLLFDVGIYITVAGMIMTVVFVIIDELE